MKRYHLNLSVVFLLVSLSVYGQDMSQSSIREQNTGNQGTKHRQYKLIDLGTLGGPSSIIFGLTGPLNNAGEVTSCADTAALDPYFPNDNPYFGGDPHVQDAFLWRHGSMHDLGSLPGGTGSCGQWISDSGIVVGASENGSFDTLAGYPAVNAVRWLNGKALNLGTFGGSESVAWAVNSRGQIAGGAANTIPDAYVDGVFFYGATQVHAFLWQQGHMRDLGTLGGSSSQGFYINDRGDVAGLSFTDDIINPIVGLPTTHPFLWKDGRMIDLGSLGGAFGSANAVNNRSQVVGQSNMPGDLTNHPFLWDRGVLTDLGTLGGANGVANWINQAGEVVGIAGLPDGTHHAFVWRRGVMKDVGTVGTDQCTNGVGINSSGVAMGTSTDCHGNVLHLFLWENGSIVNLSALIRPGSDVTFNDPVMINDRGEIAGTGEASDGSVRAVLLVPDGDCDDECDARVNSGATIRQSLRPRSETMSSPLSPSERSRSLRYRR